MAPPAQVMLTYREVGQTHVFTAAGFRGFHVGSSDLAFVYKQLAVALGEHVSRTLGCEAKYTLQCSFGEFLEHLNGKQIDSSFIVAKQAELAQQHA